MFQNQPFVDALQNRCSWIIHKIHRKAPVPESSLMKSQILRTATLLKRDSNTDFFLWNLWIIQEHLFCRGSMNGWFWNTRLLFKNTFFTEHVHWLLLAVSGFQPTTSFKMRLEQRCLSVNFAKFLRTSSDRTPPDDCFLWLSVNFEKLFRLPLL